MLAQRVNQEKSRMYFIPLGSLIGGDYDFTKTKEANNA
jgi:hypothetical protein